MILKDFVENFIECNSLIRVIYKVPGGHKIIVKDWSYVEMEHQMLSKRNNSNRSAYEPYINHEVIGIASISTPGNYQEAINIVIKEIPLNELRNNKIEDLLDLPVLGKSNQLPL